MRCLGCILYVLYIFKWNLVIFIIFWCRLVFKIVISFTLVSPYLAKFRNFSGLALPKIRLKFINLEAKDSRNLIVLVKRVETVLILQNLRVLVWVPKQVTDFSLALTMVAKKVVKQIVIRVGECLFHLRDFNHHLRFSFVGVE